MIKIKIADYHRIDRACGGICLSCGAEADSVEPDARGYACETCGEAEVYGMEECVFMEDRIAITD